MNLPDQKKAFFLLEKRSCCSKSVFISANDWREAQNALKSHCAKLCAQCEPRKRESLITFQLQQEDGTGEDKDEDDN